MEPAVHLEGAELSGVLKHLPVGVALVDSAGAIRYVNPKAEELYGWRAEEVVGKSAFALSVSPRESAAAADLVARLQMGEPWYGRLPLLRKDGSHVQAWMSVVSLPDPADEGPTTLVVLFDLADLEAGTDHPGATPGDGGDDANLLLQGLLNSVPVGMAFFDRSLRFVRVNEAVAAIDGLPVEAHVGQPLGSVMRDLPQAVVDDIEAVFETGRIIPQREVELVLWDEPDVRRHWIVSYYPVQRRGEVLWVGAILLEVTNWRRSEEERNRLLAAEQAAREAAEDAADRLTRLQLVTAHLAEAADEQAVADVVVRLGAEGAGASAGAMCVITGDELRVVMASGMDEDSTARYQVIPLDADVPAADAIRRRETVFLSSVAERDARYPSMVGVAAANRAFAAVPMVVGNEGVGSLVFGWSEERTFGDEDSQFLLSVGRQAGQALERCRLYSAERTARAQAEEAVERLRFLADASRVLASSLDYEVTLRELAGIAVPEIADVCLVHLSEENGLRLVVAAHHDPQLSDLLTSVVEAPERPDNPRLVGRAAATGQTILVETVTDEMLQRMATSPEQLAALRTLDLRSGVVLPLVVQDRTLGVLTLAGDGSSGRRFGSEDLPFLEDLAGRAAVSIDNARVHRARTEVARTLQRSLLPPHLPNIEGLELAQRYHSLGDVEVGGDFFDVFPAGDGRWGVVMGDVCGKGVAAAALTALARYTVRAGAIENSPGDVLRLLNRAILDSEVGERFCTIAHAHIEPAPGRARVQLTCGGHPLPLLLDAAGRVRPVGMPGTVIGLFEDIDVTEVDVVLEPGDALALYTDGCTEVRSPEGVFDPDLLERALSAAAGRSAEGVAEVVEEAILAFEGGRQRDDMALLILRVPAAGAQEPADALAEAISDGSSGFIQRSIADQNVLLNG